jgi:sulfatase maturation enzyme AslB (radical SAM superfamily)
MASKIQAYTAASGGFPIKIFKNLQLLHSIMEHGFIQPIHLQLNPTNKCNLKCSFCSCSNREKSLRLTKKQITAIFSGFGVLGCKSVTITGGGEPTLWKEGKSDINWVIDEAIRRGIAVGLVTNGHSLDRLQRPDRLTWARISVSDESNMQKLLGEVRLVMEANVDWSFSYVIGNNPNVNNIEKAIKFANHFGFTHVRMVNDILKPVTDLAELSQEVRSRINDNLVIWQDRQYYTAGTPRCLISLLKPVVGADGLVYPCCGTQYALATPDRDCSSQMVMGSISDCPDIWSEQRHYDGSNCVKCYYSNYNDALVNLIDDVNHQHFV